MPRLIVAIWQAQVATAERQRAEQRFGEVRQLANALIFEIHDAVAPLAGSTPVRRTIVDRASGYLERLAAEAPGRSCASARARARLHPDRQSAGSAGLGEPRRSRRRDSELPKGAVAYRTTRTIRESGARCRRLLRRSHAAVERNPAGASERRDDAMREARKAVTAAGAYYRRLPTDTKARNLLASSSFTAARATNVRSLDSRLEESWRTL